MAKLTKAQKNEIQVALNAVNRLIAFIEKPSVAFCNVKSVNIKTAQSSLDYRARDAHETKHYKGVDDREWDIDLVKELTPMDKGIGSDLVARYDIKKTLERFLENNG